MAIAPLITAALVSITLGPNFMNQILYNPNTTTPSTTSSTISDESSIGPQPSSGNANLDLIYTDVRYRVLDAAGRRYLQRIAQNTTSSSNSVLKYVNSQGSRGLCSTLYLPVLIRKKFTSNYTAEIQAYKTIMLDELNKVKVTFAYMGTTFTQNLDAHITWLMMSLDYIWDNPQGTLSQAYSVPNWGTTSTMAASACLTTINNIKS